MEYRLQLLDRCIKGHDDRWTFTELQLRFLYALLFAPYGPDAQLRPLTKDQRRVFGVIDCWRLVLMPGRGIRTVEDLALHQASGDITCINMLEEAYLDNDGFVPEGHKEWLNNERVRAEAMINTINEIKN